MRFHYYPETDSLYIELSGKPGAEAREVVPGVVLDYDAKGHLVGIDIDHAREMIGVQRLRALARPGDDRSQSKALASGGSRRSRR